MAFGMMIVMNSRSNSAVLIKQNSVIGLSQACTSPVKAIKTVLEEAKEYVRYIEEYTGTMVKLIGTGADRENMIVR